MTFGSTHICRCACHTNKDVKHVSSCCIKCHICGQNIFLDWAEKHKKWHEREIFPKGKLIAFEGVDGSGKTTQINMLSDRLWKEDKMPHRVVKDPGSTELSERIREMVLGLTSKGDGMIGDRAECLLFLAARAQLVEEVIKPALEKGELVLCDRFSDSTIAYQGYGRGLPIFDEDKVLDLASNGVVPDLRILINTDFDVIRKRILGKRIDRMEKADDSFKERVKKGYLHLAENTRRCWFIVSGNESKKEIAEHIYNYVRPFIGGINVN